MLAIFICATAILAPGLRTAPRRTTYVASSAPKHLFHPFDAEREFLGPRHGGAEEQFRLKPPSMWRIPTRGNCRAEPRRLAGAQLLLPLPMLRG